MQKCLLVTAALVATTLAVTARAEGLGVGVAAKASTNGYGVELGYRLSEHLVVRGGINKGSYTYSSTDAGINYDNTLDFDNIPLSLDWHVFGGVFRLTGGIVGNNNQVAGRASGSVNIGGGTYNTTVTTDITFKKTAPYVGLGWGNLPSKKGGLGLSFDLGVVAQGSPKAAISAPGVPPADIAAEEAALNDELKNFKYYPVVSLGIGYTF